MSCVPCIVAPASKTEWVAHLENGSVGPFFSRDVALQVAIIEALRLRRLGQSARVIVAGENGEACAQRCLCQRFGR
jgi:hypothetical protein